MTAQPVAIPDNNALGVISTLEVPEDLTVETLFIQLPSNIPILPRLELKSLGPRVQKTSFCTSETRQKQVWK